MAIYKNTEDSIIWDVFPSDFTKDGSFEQLIQQWKKAQFASLIEEEKNRVFPFIQRWGELLSRVSTITTKDLEELFFRTPLLSGVLYCSHSTVLSENFFDSQPERLSHPTDRVIAEEALKSLPSAKDLTFSFPRKYQFAGFYNSWGFVRVERKDDQGNGAAVLLSVITIDGAILDLLKKTGYKHLVNLFNQSWNGSIHDYIHHLGLYTNPSFGIGKRSPMSLRGLQKEVDAWGEDMVDTFNYEYWAHRTHRLITEDLADLDHELIIQDAHNYFSELNLFQQDLLRYGYKLSDVQRVSEYLASIYIWPLHILIHPYSITMEKIGEFLEFLILPEVDDPIKEAAFILSDSCNLLENQLQARIIIKLLKKLKWDENHDQWQQFLSTLNQEEKENLSIQFIQNVAEEKTNILKKPLINFSKLLEMDEELPEAFLSVLSEMNNPPLLKGMSVALQALQIHLQTNFLKKGDWLRFKVAITAQRGMYNCWDHDYPVIFRKNPQNPLIIFAEIFTILQKNLSLYQPYLLEKQSYELSGIHS